MEVDFDFLLIATKCCCSAHRSCPPPNGHLNGRVPSLQSHTAPVRVMDRDISGHDTLVIEVERKSSQPELPLT